MKSVELQILKKKILKNHLMLNDGEKEKKITQKFTGLSTKSLGEFFFPGNFIPSIFQN